MKNSKKRINIIDLATVVILIAVLIFVVIKAPDVKEIVTSDNATKVIYVVETQDQNPEILNFFKVDDQVFEDDSLKKMGFVTGITQKPYIIHTEDKYNKKIVEQKIPDKINVYIEITADGVIKNGNVAVDSVNILVGKTIDLNIGSASIKGVIIGVENKNEAKEEQIQWLSTKTVNFLAK